MARRSKKESMLCRTPECDKPHEFLQHEGRYYCLECFDALTETGGETTLLGAIEELQQS